MWVTTAYGTVLKGQGIRKVKTTAGELTETEVLYFSGRIEAELIYKELIGDCGGGGEATGESA